ncbi:MAG: hypothetical protein V3T26_05950 [candidate division NC10 bacterium]
MAKTAVKTVKKMTAWELIRAASTAEQTGKKSFAETLLERAVKEEVAGNIGEELGLS